MSLKSSNANVVTEILLVKSGRQLDDTAANATKTIEILLRLQIRGNHTEIRTRSKQQRREQRRPHHNIRHRHTPAAGLARYASDMKAKSNRTIGKRGVAQPSHPRCRHALAKNTRGRCDRQQATERHRRVHYRIRIAALVMLISDFESTDEAAAG